MSRMWKHLIKDHKMEVNVMEKSLKKHYGALIGLVIGTVVGIFTNTMALLLAIIIGESYDQYRSKKCEK